MATYAMVVVLNADDPEDANHKMIEVIAQAFPKDEGDGELIRFIGDPWSVFEQGPFDTIGLIDEHPEFQ